MSFLRRISFLFWYFSRPPWDSGLTPPELFAFLNDHPAGRAIDLGCGTGTNIITLARLGWQVTGLDFIPKAIEQARKDGKIRYCGFTGHLNPRAHLRVLAHQYPFDAVQLPLSVFDSHADGFQKLVLPELLKQGIAPLAMKTLGGNGKSVKDGVVTAGESLRYTLSLPVTTLISGIDSLAWLRQNAGVAAKFKPYSPEEMAALEKRCSASKQYEPYRQWAYLDGQAHHTAMA